MRTKARACLPKMDRGYASIYQQIKKKHAYFLYFTEIACLCAGKILVSFFYKIMDLAYGCKTKEPKHYFFNTDRTASSMTCTGGHVLSSLKLTSLCALTSSASWATLAWKAAPGCNPSLPVATLIADCISLSTETTDTIVILTGSALITV